MLASSNAGNSIFIASPSTRILIDPGLNRKEIVARLEAIGQNARRVDGLAILQRCARSSFNAGCAV